MIWINLIATKEGLSTHEAEALLNTQSGLLGISGLTNDMKVLVEELREHDDRRVLLAIEVFCYRARKYIGAFLAGMGGADAVVFTGGIGEHSADIRARICAGLEWAGLTIDAVETSRRRGARAASAPTGQDYTPGSSPRTRSCSSRATRCAASWASSTPHRARLGPLPPVALYGR